MLNVVETFSGIGSQTEALRKANISHRVSATSEWEVGAMFAYDIIHNGFQDLTPYRHHTRESLIEKLSRYGISSSGKEKITYQALSGMSLIQLKSIMCSIDRSNNLVDITQVHSNDLEDDIDLLTYSFPCQDLSVSSHWWHNQTGIDRNSGNRSSLLWEIERILNEFEEENKPLPKFLLMENVPAILNQRHISNFNEWRIFLEGIGYYNQTYTLNAKNFGIPQGRERTYMLSILTSSETEKKSIHTYFQENNLEDIRENVTKTSPLSKFLKLDYSNPIYFREAIESTPNFTPSREKIYNKNIKLAHDGKSHDENIARTITTKQDRHPNSGIVTYSDKNQLVDGCKYRNLTPREAFLLMGFDEKQYNQLMEANIKIAPDRLMISHSKMMKLCGNSIVVNVLEAIFLQMMEIKDFILKSD